MRGSTNNGPLKALNEKSFAEGGQRWRFIPLRARLDSTSARPSALPALDFEGNLADVNPEDTLFSHFAATLRSSADINSTATFSQYADQVKPLSLSLPLVFRNRKKLIALTLEALHASTDKGAESTSVIANCLTALSRDLGPQQFHPFFPRVAKEFSSVFDKSKGAHAGVKEGEQKAVMLSVFWDPEISMVPLFAALSEITKSHLQYLASDPKGTLESLLPLLSNSHYRVREMTAESCLGYLLRKTRDAGVIKRLTESIMNVCSTSAFKDAVVDGLGAALFEGVRLPSGRFHSRGQEVLSLALEHLLEISKKKGTGPESAPDVLERKLAIVSRCYAGLSVHLKEAADIQALYDTLLTALENAKTQQNAFQAGNIAFLLRKSLQRGRFMLTTLDAPSLQKVLNALCDLGHCFKEYPRVVYESLGALAAVIFNSSESRQEHPALRSFSALGTKVANSSQASSLIAAIAIFLRLRSGFRDKGRFVTVDQSYGLLCEQLARLPSCEVENANSSRYRENSRRALRVAVMWMEIENENMGQIRRSPILRVPTLEDHLRRKLLFEKDSEACLGEGLDEFHDELLYLSFVRLTNVNDIFNRLFSAKFRGVENQSNLLNAFCFQFSGRNGDAQQNLVEGVRGIVEYLMKNGQSSLTSIIAVKALCRFTCSFKEEARRIIDGAEDRIQECITVLRRNLSSHHYTLRKESINLLFAIFESKKDAVLGHKEESDDEQDEGGLLKSKLEKLRSSLRGRDMDISDFYDILRFVMEADRLLVNMQSRLRLLQELGRILRDCKDLNPIAVETSIHFSIGLLRMPLKVLWNVAGEIWGAATCHVQDVGMTVIVNYIEHAQDELLKARSQSTEEDIVKADEEDSEDIDGSDEQSSLQESLKTNVARQSEAYPKASADHDSTSESKVQRKTKKRFRSGMRTLKSGWQTEIVSKRQRARGHEVALKKWDHSEYKSFCDEPVDQVISSLLDLWNNPFAKDTDLNRTNYLSFLQQLLRALTKEPKHTLLYRSKIIKLYLRFDSSSLSRRVADLLTTCYATLLEKMGGLKCCESDRDLEKRMRDRLLADLTRPNASLQTAVLRCLCSSRSASLKLHRDSFIRLIEETTFREELTVLTEILFPNWQSCDATTLTDSESELVLNVLVRICFSKMMGKRAKMDSRRSAVLSFVVSKLPSELALSRIVSLAMSPIADAVEQLKQSISLNGLLSVKGKLPPLNVQLGVLSSIESVLKHCKRSLPSSSWQQIAHGSSVLLQSAKGGGGGQNMRSRTLRILGEMCYIRPMKTAFLILPVIRTVKGANFDMNAQGDGQGAPALLHFISAVCSTDLLAIQKTIVIQESWVLKWSLRFLETETVQVSTIDLSLAIARWLVSAQETLACGNAVEGTHEDQALYKDLLSVLALSLKSLLTRLVNDVMGNRTLQKTWKHIFESALELTEQLTKTDPVQSDVLLHLCEGLTSYLVNTNFVSTSTPGTIRALTAIATIFCDTVNRKTVNKTGAEVKYVRNLVLQLLPKFGDCRFIQEPASYQDLCTLFASLGLRDLFSVSSVLRSVNAMDEIRLDCPDIDKRIDGLNLIIKGFKDALGDLDNEKSLEVKEVEIPDGSGIQSNSAPCSGQAILALAYGCIAAVRFDDIAVRGTSSYALQLLTKWVAISSSTSARECRSMIFGLLLESTASAKTSILRREFCQSLAELVEHSDMLTNDKSCPDAQIFSLLKDATRQQDRESNFFHNLVHMQAHRRGRALRWLQKELLGKEAKETLFGTEEFNARVLLASRFAFPLGLCAALESDYIDDTRSNRPSRHNEAKESARKDVTVWAISLAGASAQWLPWSEYKSTIIGLMRRLKGSVENKQDNMLYKVVVKVAEGFPSLENEESLEYASRKQFLVDVLLPKMLLHVSKGGSEDPLVDTSGKSFAGNEGSQHRRGTPTIFRAPIAIAAGHLLTRLPETDINTFVSLLVNPLANALRSRMITTRDSAKKALITVLLLLGSKYLLYVLRQVLAALSQGFRKDACVYVIHSILVAVKEHNDNSSSENSSMLFVIDDACEVIASHLADEFESGTSVIMNDFQDPNTSSTRQKQASARAAKALECEEMLAELISFDKSAHAIIKPLNRLLTKSPSVKVSSRVENALQKLVIGFSRNSSMTPKNAIGLCQGFVFPIANNKPAADDGDQNAGTSRTRVEPHGGMVVDYRVIKFGFLFLKSVLSKNMSVIASKSSDCTELQLMLEPFLPMVLEALQTKHDSLKLLAFQVAQKLLKVPLRKRKDIAEKVSEIIVEVLSQSAGVLSHSDDLFNSCLRAAAILFHEFGESGLKNVPTERVEALVTIACNCIENGSIDARTAALAFLRATISARIVIPAIYDAIEKVNDMAIRAQSAALRSACTSLSIAFMTSFPVGSKRVRQQLEFFVRNLNYELADGRLAALEALNTIILKFPAEVLENECEYLFLALVASMARDLDGRCRSSSSVALQQLFRKIPAGRKIVDMLKMASVLLGAKSSMSSVEENVDAKLPKDAEVVLSGALAFTAVCKSGRLTLTQLGLVVRVLLAALKASSGEVQWEITYALLQGLEAGLNAQGEVSQSHRLEVQLYFSPLWKMMPRLLLDKHQWIRLSSARLLGKHLSASGGREARREHVGTKQFSVFWGGDGLVRSLLRSCCLQLEANHLSEDLGQQCLKNVLCIGDVVFKNPSIGDVSFEELSVNGMVEGQKDDDKGDSDSVAENRGIRWLLFRMCGLGMKAGEEVHEMLRRGCALRFLLVTAKWWGMEFVRSNAQAYVAPIVKILESSKGDVVGTRRESGNVGKEAEDEDGEINGLCELGMRLQDALVEGLGASKYYEVYQEIRNKRESVRNARKRQVAFEAAVNPERAAKKRRKRAEKRKNKKKKKQSGKVRGENDDVDAVLRAKEELTADL